VRRFIEEIQDEQTGNIENDFSSGFVTPVNNDQLCHEQESST
jgi:hypothetical protein